jgi:hypothetical protein
MSCNTIYCTNSYRHIIVSLFHRLSHITLFSPSWPFWPLVYLLLPRPHRNIRLLYAIPQALCPDNVCNAVLPSALPPTKLYYRDTYIRTLVVSEGVYRCTKGTDKSIAAISHRKHTNANHIQDKSVVDFHYSLPCVPEKKYLFLGFALVPTLAW